MMRSTCAPAKSFVMDLAWLADAELSARHACSHAAVAIASALYFSGAPLPRNQYARCHGNPMSRFIDKTSYIGADASFIQRLLIYLPRRISARAFATPIDRRSKAAALYAGIAIIAACYFIERPRSPPCPLEKRLLLLFRIIATGLSVNLPRFSRQ